MCMSSSDSVFIVPLVISVLNISITYFCNHTRWHSTLGLCTLILVTWVLPVSWTWKAFDLNFINECVLYVFQDMYICMLLPMLLWILNKECIHVVMCMIWVCAIFLYSLWIEFWYIFPFQLICHKELPTILLYSYC